MPLKIRVKPEKKFFVAGIPIKNVGTRPIDLLILDDQVKVEREDYQPKGTTQPLTGDSR